VDRKKNSVQGPPLKRWWQKAYQGAATYSPKWWRVAAPAFELALAYECRNSFDWCRDLDSILRMLFRHPETFREKEPQFNRIARCFVLWRFWHCECSEAIKLIEEPSQSCFFRRTRCVLS
jgi:hypothetical protein